MGCYNGKPPQQAVRQQIRAERLHVPVHGQAASTRGDDRRWGRRGRVGSQGGAVILTAGKIGGGGGGGVGKRGRWGAEAVSSGRRGRAARWGGTGRLPPDPAFNLSPFRRVGLARRPPAEQHVEHPQQADDRVEWILTVRRGAKAVLDLRAQG